MRGYRMRLWIGEHRKKMSLEGNHGQKKVENDALK